MGLIIFVAKTKREKKGHLIKLENIVIWSPAGYRACAKGAGKHLKYFLTYLKTKYLNFSSLTLNVGYHAEYR